MYYFLYVILPRFKPYAKYVYFSLLVLGLVFGILLITLGVVHA